VESSGKVRFFTAETDHEYSCWTREIQKVASYYQATDSPKGSGGAVLDSELVALSDRDDWSVSVDSTGQTSAPQRSPGKGFQIRGALAGLGASLKLSKEDSRHIPLESETVSIEGQTTEESTTAADLAESQDVSVSSNRDEPEAPNMEDSSPPRNSASSPENDDRNESAGSSNRRLQIKGKLAGVGQVTKGWGSALMGARQKGREAAERTRRAAVASPAKLDARNASTDSTLHVITEKDDEVADHNRAPATWACPQCTFINNLQGGETDILICSMCESATSLGSVAIDPPSSNLDETQPPSSSELMGNAASAELANEDMLNPSGSESKLFRRSSSEVGAVRERVNSSDSGKLIFRRTQSAEDVAGYIEEDEISIISDLAMDDQSEAARTGGRPRGARNRLGGLGAAFGSVRRPRPKAPSQDAAENKSWFGRLGSNVSSQEGSGEFQKPQAAVKLKNVKVNQSAEFRCDATKSILDIPLQKLDGQWFAVVKPAAPSSLSRQNQELPSEISAAAEERADQGSVSNSGEKVESGIVAGKSLSERINMESTAQQSLPMSVGGDTFSKSIAGGASNLVTTGSSTEKTFCIQLFHLSSSEDTRKQPKGEVYKKLSEVVGLHAVLSESVTELIHHPLFQRKSMERIPSGDMSYGLKNAFGISPLDSIRISGKFLAGALEAAAKTPSIEAFPVYFGEIFAIR
jgi:hypothetical protein